MGEAGAHDGAQSPAHHAAGAVRAQGHRDVHPRPPHHQEECPDHHQERRGAHQGHPHHRVDLKSQNLNYKIRDHSLAKIPLLLICGKKEVDSNSVTIRRLDSNKQENMELNTKLKKFSALNKASSN